MKMKCESFKATRYICDYFISNGSCSRPNKFMCEVFIDTGHQPVQDDIPIHLEEVLKAFPDATVVDEVIKDAVTTGIGVVKDGKHIPSKDLMEEFFGKL